MSEQRTDDSRWMRRALELAARGLGRVEPNPAVGAVIVKDGRCIGEGFHRKFGDPHAEVHAIQAAGDGCRNATLYVTLAPCTGRAKKTPPCCDAVIAARFTRVVIGAIDPTQEAAAPLLEAAGMIVTTGVLSDECEHLIAPFLKLRQAGRPWVIAKWAMTADGKVATGTGDSKWISGETSRARVHEWRNRIDAILVGIGTVRADDPLLTCRMPEGRNPRRIILDAHATLPPESQLIRTIKDAPVIVACLDTAEKASRDRLADAGCTVVPLPGDEAGVDIGAFLDYLGQEQVTNLMVEGGPTVLGGFFGEKLVDEVRVFIAPKIVGGASAPSPVAGEGVRLMADALPLSHVAWTPIGENMLLTGRV